MMDTKLLGFCGKMEVLSTQKLFCVNQRVFSKTRDRLFSALFLLVHHQRNDL
jgi:hypothetical protein